MASDPVQDMDMANVTVSKTAAFSRELVEIAPCINGSLGRVLETGAIIANDVEEQTEQKQLKAMASFSGTATPSFAILAIFFILTCNVQGQSLSANFYASSCPNLRAIVRSAMVHAVNKEARMGGSILRLFYHDCFVNGCDASILLDDTATFTGEKTAGPNNNFARGFEVIDAIKSRVEASCKATVSCADILALASRDGVVALGGLTWAVQLRRRDATTASQSAANTQIPAPTSSLSTLIKMLSKKGLNARDMTALSGAHTVGQAQSLNFRTHIYNETDINARFASLRQQTCPFTGGDSNLPPLDMLSPTRFGNDYYRNLVAQRGLLHSDQELFNNGSQDAVVRQYVANGATFASDFAAAMVKMGSISPLTGSSGEIRLNCRKVNSC